MLDIYITFQLPDKILSRLSQNGLKFEMWMGVGVVPRATLMDKIKGVRGLICRLSDRIDADVLKAAGDQLKVVSTISVGYDHVDLPALKSAGVRLGYTPEILTNATAELTVTLLLTVSRKMREASLAVSNGEWGTWEPFWMCGKGLENATVGIFGLGRIGKTVATNLAAFRPKRIIYTSSGRKPTASVHLFTKPDGTRIEAESVPLDELLRESDFLCVCCALTEGTKAFFNDETFGKMKSGAVFINTARGAMVDHEALYRALTKKEGGLWGAGLDVMTPEPLPVDSPLLQLSNCFILPHIGSATLETRWTMAERTIDNLLAGLSEPPVPMPSELKF